MSESLKFGPEWLRNSISTSPTKHEETISRPILSENRYSREEMLSFCDTSAFKPDPHATYSKVFNEQWQMPLSFQTEEREKERPTNANSGQGRLFLNSNLKHNGGGGSGTHWRKSNEEKLSENWRTQRDTGGSGVFFNNTYNDPNRKMSWRNPENTIENLHEQQKSPPSKYPEGSVITNRSPPFISPINKEILEYHRQSQDNVKNYFENQNHQSPTASSLPPSISVDEKMLNLSSKENPIARKLFESDQTAGGTKQQNNQVKIKEKEASEKINENIRKLEVDLVKNLTDLVIKSEQDFHKGDNVGIVGEPMPSTSSSTIVPERPPIFWFYVDPHGKVQGPFTEEEMSFWYQNNYFHENLMVKRSFDNNFIPLRTLIGAYGTAHPFTVASNYFPIPKIENYFDQFHPNQDKSTQVQQFVGNIDVVNQMPQNFNPPVNSFVSQSKPPQLQVPLNFLAQPFPAINKPQLSSSIVPSCPQIDRRMILNNGNNSVTIPQITQIPTAFPPINNCFDMNINPINFPTPKQPLQNAMFKPIVSNNNHFPVPQPQSGQFMQQQRPLENNGNCMGGSMESIQKMLFDIQKQHEMQIQQQQKVNYFQQQQPFTQSNHGTIPQPFANHNSIINSCGNQVNNFSKAPTSMQRRSPKKQDSVNFDADDEDDFQKVQNPRKKRFQNEEEAIQVSEKIKNHFIEQPKAANAIASMESINKSKHFMRAKDIVTEEKTNQPAMPAPWFNKVVVSQSDDSNVNNIQFTIADQSSNIKPVAWPKISPIQNEDVKNMKKRNLNTSVTEEEKKNTQSAMTAPWLKKIEQNQHDDEKCLKKIQIEEEEVRQIELQIKRDREKREMEMLRQKEMSNPMWKPIVVDCAEKDHKTGTLFDNNAHWVNSQLPLNSKKKNHKRMELQENEIQVNNKESALDNWCVETLKKMNIPCIDIHAFSNFLQSIDSPFEIEDYVKAYLGDTMQSNDFLKKYLNYRSNYRNSKNSKQQADDDLCAPAKAINPPPSTSSAASSINGEEKKVHKKKRNKEAAKKSKKNMKVMDANILGFKGAADPNRIVGELDVLNNYVHFDD